MSWEEKFKQLKADRAARQANKADGVRPKYQVLQVDMMKSVDRERAAAVASFVRSGEEAYHLEGQEGFSYKDLDLRGRCGVVLYRGIEVALLFKREIIEREPAPAEPVPERVLKEPVDRWMSIDLINSEPATARKGIGDRLRQALAQVDRLQLLWQSEEGLRKAAEEQLAKRAAERDELKVLREKVAQLETLLKATEKESDGRKRDLQLEREKRLEDKNKTIRELMPVFNTTWLAGQHNVKDQLYGIIRKQMTDGLAGLGVALIEPAVGDPFNPEQHHAVHAYPFPSGAKEIGTVVKLMRVGWKVGSLVQEAADVAVGVEKEEVINVDNDTSANPVDGSGSSQVVG